MLGILADLLLMAAGTIVAFAAFRYLARSEDTQNALDQLTILHDAAMADLAGKQIMAEVGRQAPDAIWFKDADDDLRIFWINHTYVEQYLAPMGKDAADYVGHKDGDVWPARVAAEFRRNDRAVLAAGKTLRTVETLADGTALYITKSPHTTTTGRRLVRGQAIPLALIFQAMAEARVPRGTAVAMLDNAYGTRTRRS